MKEETIKIEMIKESDVMNLVKSILEWWKEHEYDVDITYDDKYPEEFNRYDETPKFVKLAKKLNRILKSKKLRKSGIIRERN